MKIVENVSSNSSRRNLGEGKLQYRLSSLSNHNSNINENNNNNTFSSNSNATKIKKSLVPTTATDNNESLTTADNFYFVASSSLPDLDLRHQAGLEQRVNKNKKSKHREQLSSSLFAYSTKYSHF